MEEPYSLDSEWVVSLNLDGKKNNFYIYPSPPLNENKLIQLARHVSI
jgi:hypothetical protein